MVPSRNGIQAKITFGKGLGISAADRAESASRFSTLGFRPWMSSTVYSQTHFVRKCLETFGKFWGQWMSSRCILMIWFPLCKRNKRTIFKITRNEITKVEYNFFFLLLFYLGKVQWSRKFREIQWCWDRGCVSDNPSLVTQQLIRVDLSPFFIKRSLEILNEFLIIMEVKTVVVLRPLFAYYVYLYTLFW